MLVEVVSPEQNFFSGEATMVISRTPEGEIGILAGHEPTVATLVPGGLTVDQDGTRQSYAISGGVLQITGEKVLILGASGMLGSVMYKFLSRLDGLDVFGTIRSPGMLPYFDHEFRKYFWQRS